MVSGLFHIPESVSIALHTCLWLADGDPSYRASAEIARQLGFSYHHVAKIVPRLVQAKLLETSRGPKGGIRLAGNPRQVTLLDIYIAAGGAPLTPHRCLLDPNICAGRACAFGHLVESENNRLRNKMKRTTLAALARTFDRTCLETA